MGMKYNCYLARAKRCYSLAVEVGNMERNLGHLGLIAGIAPTLGFIGTISGVIKIFYTISITENVSIGNISGGLYEKMISSGAGLIVGIIALRRTINSAFITIFSIVSWVSIFIGVTAVEHFNMSKEHPMGFGWKVTLVMVCILPLTYYYLKSPDKFKKITRNIIF